VLLLSVCTCAPLKPVGSQVLKLYLPLVCRFDPLRENFFAATTSAANTTNFSTLNLSIVV
jgi:hypothetical protein